MRSTLLDNPTETFGKSWIHYQPSLMEAQSSAPAMLPQMMQPVEVTRVAQQHSLMASNTASLVLSMDPLPVATGVAFPVSLSG